MRFPRVRAFLHLGLLASIALAARAETPAEFAVVAYNVENLHDLDGVAVYDDYQPADWTPAHLAVKVKNIARVLASVDAGAGPAIVAFNEIELDRTPDSGVPGGDLPRWLASVADRPLDALVTDAAPGGPLAGLPAEAWLLKACADAGLPDYHVATTDESPGSRADGRGVAVRNVVFSRFPITAVRSLPLRDARAILEVRVDVGGWPLTILANHWKSGASDPALEEIRRDNARVLRARLDEILRADPQADVIIAGDLNSHYNQRQRYREMRSTGINDILGSQGNELALRGRERDLYNLWFELPAPRRGSDIFREEWGTLMHLIVARGLYDQRGVQYVDNSFAVLKIPGLNEDVYGRPLRWSRGREPAGFSDHFPLLARFRVVGDGPADKWMPLKDPSRGATGPGTPIRVETSTVDVFAHALKLAELPADADLRSGAYTGRVFLVEDAPSEVNDAGWVSVRLRGRSYDVFTHDKELRPVIRDAARAGPLRFYGELGQYKGRWQFVVHDRTWLASAK